jgi:hypothetical protein
LRYAESISTDVRAVYVNDNVPPLPRSRRMGNLGRQRTPVVLESPFRSLMEPLMAYIAPGREERTNAYITIVLA